MGSEHGKKLENAESQFLNSNLKINEQENFEYWSITRSLNSYISKGLSLNDLKYRDYIEVLLSIIRNEYQLKILEDDLIKMVAIEHLAIMSKRCKSTHDIAEPYRAYLKAKALDNIHVSYYATTALATLGTGKDIAFIENFIKTNEYVTLNNGSIYPSELAIYALSLKIQDSFLVTNIRERLLSSLSSKKLKSYVKSTLIPEDGETLTLPDGRCP